MNRWSARLLGIVFAFVIVFLAAIASVSVSAILRSHSNRVAGIIFLTAVACLVPFFEKMFPSVYSGSREGAWWQTRAGGLVFGLVLGIIISILSSRVVTLWFGLLIIAGVLVALLLRATRSHGEQ